MRTVALGDAGVTVGHEADGGNVSVGRELGTELVLGELLGG